MTVVRGLIMPRPAPPNTKAIWERDVPGVGLVFMNGSVVRDGKKSYLLRVLEDGKNPSIVCLILVDGSVGKWYYGWGAREPKVQSALEEAREFVLAHHVLGS